MSATDLVLSGAADNPLSPVHATSLAWIDADTVQFNLSGALVAGTLDVAFKAVRDRQHHRPEQPGLHR